jgi:CheY-like chemotaxis protein
MKHILLVDDDPDESFLFSLAMKEFPEIIKLTYLNDCRKLVHYLSANQPPDLIFLDVNMPGLDGLTCLELIRKQALSAGIPVIMYSNSTSPNKIEKAYASGAASYIVKPVHISELTSIIKEAIGDNPSTMNERKKRSVQPF